MWFPDQYFVTSTPQTLTTILGLDHNYPIKQAEVKNSVDSTHPVYVGKADVTNVPDNAGIELSPDDVWTIGPFSDPTIEPITTDDVYVVGTAGSSNIVFVSVIL